jgi:hypothetical protein
VSCPRTPHRTIFCVVGNRKPREARAGHLRQVRSDGFCARCEGLGHGLGVQTVRGRRQTDKDSSTLDTNTCMQICRVPASLSLRNSCGSKHRRTRTAHRVQGRIRVQVPDSSFPIITSTYLRTWCGTRNPVYSYCMGEQTVRVHSRSMAFPSARSQPSLIAAPMPCPAGREPQPSNQHKSPCSLILRPILRAVSLMIQLHVDEVGVLVVLSSSCNDAHPLGMTHDHASFPRGHSLLGLLGGYQELQTSLLAEPSKTWVTGTCQVRCRREWNGPKSNQLCLKGHQH